MASLTSPQSEVRNLPSSLLGWLLHLVDCDVRAISSMVILILMVFVNASDFQGADPDQFAFKWQIYLRLAVCGIAGLYALIHINDVYPQLQKFPGALALLYGAWITATVPFSMDFRYSAVSTICLWSAILFVPVAIKQAGKYRFIVAVMFGALFYVAVSWFLYFFVPEIGVWKEYIGAEESLDRMGGLGHPNALGFFVSCAFVMAIVLLRDGMIRTSEAFIISLFWLATIYFCLSRTSFAIALLGASAVYIDRLRYASGVSLVLFGLVGPALIGMYLAFFGDIDNLIRELALSVSKSGDAAEVATATGRTEIWQFAIEQIQLRPVTGCGYGCARFAMVDYSYHAHNLILNAGVMTGLVGLLLIAAMCWAIVVKLFRQPDAYLRGIVTVFLVGGIVESLIYDPSPTLPIILFFSLLFWPSSSDKPNHRSDKSG